MINDISKYHNKEKVLKYQAFYDQLTGIPNRILFFDRAENALNQTIRTKDSLCLFYIDIDEGL